MKFKVTYKIDGKEVSEKEYERLRKSRGIYGGATRARIARGKQVKFPVYNDALGIHPKQKAQFEARNALHGTNVKYTNDGRAIIESETQLKRQMKLDGRIDRKGYYS